MTIFFLSNSGLLPYLFAQSQEISAEVNPLMMVLAVIIGIAAYIFNAYCFMKIYDRLGEADSWFAWVPILDTVKMYQAGGQSPFWIIGFFVPLVNIVAAIFLIIAFVNIVKRLGKNPWLILLMLIPLASFFVLYHFAFN
jgi:flagellar biogenesis protein FliO